MGPNGLIHATERDLMNAKFIQTVLPAQALINTILIIGTFMGDNYRFLVIKNASFFHKVALA